jgi:hypothetical protein
MSTCCAACSPMNVQKRVDLINKSYLNKEGNNGSLSLERRMFDLPQHLFELLSSVVVVGGGGIRTDQIVWRAFNPSPPPPHPPNLHLITAFSYLVSICTVPTPTVSTLKVFVSYHILDLRKSL